MMMASFELPIVPRPEDIDALGHVNNIVYLSWIQDVAAARWRALTSPEQRAEIARPGDGRTLVQARTTWCSVDPASGRPRRIPEAIRTRFAG